MYEFKLKLCPNKDPHDWTLCMWAHEGEVARRRNPSCHSGNPCVEYEKMQTCPRGDRCPYAHGVWERGLHPQRYRTSLCANVAAGGKCNRKICFFAHGEETVKKFLPWALVMHHPSSRGDATTDMITLDPASATLPSVRGGCRQGPRRSLFPDENR